MFRKENGDTKPAGRKTAFAFYVQACREDYELKNPNVIPNFVKFMKDCSSNWGNMPEPEKQHFLELAERDKERYNAEVGNDKNTDCGTQGTKRKLVKNTTPCRPFSAFYWFCNEQRPAVIAQNPEYKVSEVAVVLGRKWINSPSDVKEKYESVAEKDRTRYEAGMEEFKKKGNYDCVMVSDDD